MNTQINNFTRLSFFLYLLSIPFETAMISRVSFFNESNVWSLSRVTGLILVIALLTNEKLFYKKRSAPLFFIIYSIVYLIIVLFFLFSNVLNLSVNLFTIPWLVINYLISFIILSDEENRNLAKWVVLIGISLCSVLQLLNIANNRISFMTWDRIGSRISAFNEDPNFIGAQYGIGIILSLAFVFGLFKSNKTEKIISIVCLIVCILGLIQTGSRSAVITLFLSIIIFAFAKVNFKQRLYIIFALILISFFIFMLVIYSEGFRLRFESTFSFGDTSNRLEIYLATLGLIQKNPLVGIGPIRNQYILGSIFNKTLLDTHNVFLWVLSSTGIFGFTPFFLGIVFSISDSIKSRFGYENIVPFVLLSYTLLFSLTAGWSTEKLFWVVLSFSSSSPFLSKDKKIVIVNAPQS